MFRAWYLKYCGAEQQQEQQQQQPQQQQQQCLGPNSLSLEILHLFEDQKHKLSTIILPGPMPLPLWNSMLELSRLIVKLHLLVGSLPGVHISFMPEPVPFDQKLCDEPLKVLCAQPGSEVQER